jgi:hypothetical protein
VVAGGRVKSSPLPCRGRPPQAYTLARSRFNEALSPRSVTRFVEYSREHRMYLFKSFVDQRVIVSFGTDALATGYKVRCFRP